jgi:hypothetical protein
MPPPERDAEPEEKDTKESSRYVPVSESVENIMEYAIHKLLLKEAGK